MTISSAAQELLNTQQRTQELGIEELVRNVVHQSSDSKEHAQAKWEGCTLIFDAQAHGSSIFAALASLSDSLQPDQTVGTSVIMSDGTFLYNATLKGTKVKAFREGPWVERLTAYSKQLTEQHLQQERDKEQNHLEEQRKPFQDINF